MCVILLSCRIYYIERLYAKATVDHLKLQPVSFVNGAPDARVLGCSIL